MKQLTSYNRVAGYLNKIFDLLNAEYFEKKGYAVVINQNTATTQTLVDAINHVYENREQFAGAMRKDNCSDGKEVILNIIRQAAQHG